MDIYYRTSRNYQYWVDNIFPQSARARVDKICKPSIKRIQKVLDPYLNFQETEALEIGPGFGLFAKQCCDENIFKSFEVIEPTPPLAKHCKELGLSVHQIDIESFISNAKAYNFICAFEVIEHIYNPFDFLQRCNQLLKPQGILCISCPNGIGFDTKMLGSFSPSVDNEHVNLFSPAGIEIILKRSGFKVINLQTPGKMDVEIVLDQINESPDTFKCEKDLRTLLGLQNNSINQLQEKISSENNSGHMWVFAQKYKTS
ncbi:3-demethylubiquinone-9 3-methyltransferase [Prochlorococcus sp. MIT 0601]|nr:3-demethylubiquinone-9 3-methyltransferase [Prochlorococcus sp. MIT 0601]